MLGVAVLRNSEPLNNRRAIKKAERERMMNRKEHLLTILGEECSELHQEICKALRFGVYDQQPGYPLDNSERIFKAFNDLMAMIEMVNEEEVKTSFRDSNVTLGERGLMYVNKDFILNKKKKVEKYLLYSEKVGTLTI